MWDKSMHALATYTELNTWPGGPTDVVRFLQNRRTIDVDDPTPQT